MRNLKFRRAHFFDEKKTKFSNFTEWGVGLNGTSFTSPAHTNYAIYFIDCQLTDLKDKNGKEIYESDLVKCKNSEQGKRSEYYEEIRPVIFNNGGFEAMSQFNDWHTDNNGNLRERNFVHSGSLVGSDIYYVQFDLEIIGNIFQHKELLK